MGQDINLNEEKPVCGGGAGAAPVLSCVDNKCSEEALKKCFEETQARSLSKLTKFCYGVGHVYNDLCASMWFSFLLIFYEKVLLFEGGLAGFILLVGQLADGFSTPIVGILSDKESRFPLLARYGRRKIWHLIGTVCVTVSFTFIFSPCYGCENGGNTIQTIYYCFFIIVFQFGWAAVQISHLALIPDLTAKKHMRTELNSIRYAFTVLANLSVFAITYVVLYTDDNAPTTTLAPDMSTSDGTLDFTVSIHGMSSVTTPNTTMTDECPNTNNSLGPADLNKFRLISIICVGIGLIFSVIFHIGVKEPRFICRDRNEQANVIVMRKRDWFRQPPFYLVAVLYMATRLYVNLYQVYMPMFIQNTLCLAKTAVATIPFTMYLAGFFVSLGMKQLNKLIGRQGTFCVGCLIGLSGCAWVYVDGERSHTDFVTWGIYLVAILLGSGGSTVLITSLCITADLIASNTEGGAFVYGFMSLVDKFSNGIIIMLIQTGESQSSGSSYYREVIFWACGGACVLGILTAAGLQPMKVSERRGMSAFMSGPATDDGVDDGATGIRKWSATPITLTGRESRGPSIVTVNSCSNSISTIVAAVQDKGNLSCFTPKVAGLDDSEQFEDVNKRYSLQGEVNLAASLSSLPTTSCRSSSVQTISAAVQGRAGCQTGNRNSHYL